MLFYCEYGIRCYGFYGISYKFIFDSMVKIFEKLVLDISIISVYLGNGCSVLVIEKGVVVDISFGFIFFEGLVMGICCGDLDLSLLGML